MKITCCGKILKVKVGKESQCPKCKRTYVGQTPTKCIEKHK